ncbi:DHA2 family efflux MFS transporter permease subunit [Cerasicoccus arenae]|uniref:EmrB/QacA family drug resistance transporter n=1 Tax=Cerasicoccus arenae TaxID=424488 RepID=A0A8J3GE14_9BACT|nr:DHA2 family efflux MFS transporter permease subunit [Cerasicoccus arenae]MBK1858526.1 DHA2 family efflux MFS transporter permease subunit [Cerasicoccus arenae]GHC06105.1 EmrB/QacA family drug resistance transporter [Cerasicoccus arenae]
MPTEEAKGHPQRYWIALAVTLSSLVEGLDTSVVNVSVPQMMGSFGVSLDAIAWVSTGYILSNVIIIPLTGWLASLFGRKRYFTGSLALFTLASFLCGHAGSLESLIFWRVVQGIGGGALVATSQAILYEVFPPREHSRAMAIWGMGIMVGPAMGPVLGGYLTETMSWPWIFYINIPVCIAALILVVFLVPESKYREKVRKVDFLGLLLLAIGLGACQLLLEDGNKIGWLASAAGWELTGLTLFCLGLFIWRELTFESPVVDLRIVGNLQFSACCLFTFVQALCTLAIVFVTPLLLLDLMGYSALQTGFIMLPVAVGTSLVMFVVGRISHLCNPYGLILGGVAIFLYAMWKYSYFDVLTPDTAFTFPLLLRGIGLGMIFVPLNALAVADLPPSKQAAATGLLNLTRQFGASVGVAVAAAVLGSMQGQFEAQLIDAATSSSPELTIVGQDVMNMLHSEGVINPTAHYTALKLLHDYTHQQATSIAFDRIFTIFGLALLAAVPLIVFMRKNPDRSNPAPTGH